MVAVGFTVIALLKILDKILDASFINNLFGDWKDVLDGVILFAFIIITMMYADYLYVRDAETKILEGKTRGGVTLLPFMIFGGVLLALLVLIVKKTG